MNGEKSQKSPKVDTDADVINQFTGERWYYSDIVKDHFFNPRNLMLDDPDEARYDAVGMVGSPSCGDMMKMWLKIEPYTEKVKVMHWRTFGCGSAIAATSMFSVMVTENGGLPLDEALKIKPQHIMERLGGLPNRKIHCSVLADKAFRKAANDYFRKTKQFDRIIIEGARVIDPKLNITDKDIEEAVLEGAVDLDAVQKKLKVGVGSPEIIIEVEQLIRFYKEKYYG
jgi:NifU-like protein involved in Fe-S cluster formation